MENYKEGHVEGKQGGKQEQRESGINRHMFGG